MTTRPISLKIDCLIFLSGLILFTIGLAQFGSCHGLGLEGSRFVLFTQEMFRHGVTYFPTVYDSPYPDYTVTQTLLAYLFSLFTGHVSTFTVVLPTAMATSITLLLTYRIGALYSVRWGIAAVLMEIATFEFFILARAPSLDQFVTTATIFCFYLVFTAKKNNSALNYWLLALGLMGGFLFRGVIGLVIPASVVCAFYLGHSDYRRFFSTAFLSISLLILCTLGLIALAYHAGGSIFAKEIWQLDIIGRLHDSTLHYIFYYYLVAGLTTYAPTFLLALLVLAGSRKKIFTPQNSAQADFLIKSLASWFFIILIGLSIPIDKHARYIVGLVPAAALLASYPVIFITENPFFTKLRLWTLRISRSLPWIAIVAVCGGIIFNHFTSQPFDAYFKTALVVLLILLSLTFFLPSLHAHAYLTRPLASLSIGVTTLLIAYILILVPIAEQFNSLRPLASMLQSWLTPSTKIAFYNVGPDGETDDVKLMAQLNSATIPQFLSLPTEIARTNNPTLFLTQEPYFHNLPANLKPSLTVLFSGNIDGDIWVIFTKKN